MNMLMSYVYISKFAERVLQKRNINLAENLLRTKEAKKQNKAA